MSRRRDIWSGRVGFILATIGSAVGLGSIWKFPYEVGSNGGSAFVLFYLFMPVLAVLMVGLACYSIIEGDAMAAFRFLFRLDPQHLTARTALDALGLGFFSIGVGFALMVTYAAYAGHDVNLKQVAIASIVADTAISFLAGFAVFPIVFAHGLDPANGPGLVFVTLPLAFAKMPYGTIAAGAFFVLLFIAALASAISMMELAVAAAVQRLTWRRVTACWIVAGACFVLGLATVLSFNLWAGWYPLEAMRGFSRATVFDLLDYLTSNLLLPVCGFALALFVGWALPASLLIEELHLTPTGSWLLRAALRYIVPTGIAAATLLSLFR